MSPALHREIAAVHAQVTKHGAELVVRYLDEELRIQAHGRCGPRPRTIAVARLRRRARYPGSHSGQKLPSSECHEAGGLQCHCIPLIRGVFWLAQRATLFRSRAPGHLSPISDGPRFQAGPPGGLKADTLAARTVASSSAPSPPARGAPA